jgi:hypothetical protein
MDARLTKRTKLARALVLRDAALTVLKHIGIWETVTLARGASGARDIKVLSARLGNLHILHRTPFQRMPQPDDLLKYRAAQISLIVPQNLLYGLDLWAAKKVLNIEWDDKGSVVLISLHHGAWETELITLATSLSPLSEGQPSGR